MKNMFKISITALMLFSLTGCAEKNHSKNEEINKALEKDREVLQQDEKIDTDKAFIVSYTSIQKDDGTFDFRILLSTNKINTDVVNSIKKHVDRASEKGSKIDRVFLDFERLAK
ncbi:hypothetical protein [Aliarcobacter butzleri]|uniref:hypothetical protein n=1 Tax=Aliarcobacter butzleri TaxID=28197 RepID=UPI00126A1714|nr:hypothetical protein [Aliarcobacter butzleri]